MFNINIEIKDDKPVIVNIDTSVALMPDDEIVIHGGTSSNVVEQEL